MNHLWLYLVVGYAVIWAAMIWADKKRGQPIEDAGLYQRISQKQMALMGYLPLLALLMRSLKIADELAASAASRGIEHPGQRTSLRQVQFRLIDALVLLAVLMIGGIGGFSL